MGMAPMPKLRRKKLPEAIFRHLLLRARERNITRDQFVELSLWLETDPTVPSAKWFKRFRSFTLCGEGELIKTFLVAGQIPTGEEIL
jgi:hypothetical protein